MTIIFWMSIALGLVVGPVKALIPPTVPLPAVEESYKNSTFWIVGVGWVGWVGWVGDRNTIFGDMEE